MASTMASDMVLLVVMILLCAAMLKPLMLIFACYAWLHEPLVMSAVHHHVLALLMALIIHSKVIMRRGLGDW